MFVVFYPRQWRRSSFVNSRTWRTLWLIRCLFIWPEWIVRWAIRRWSTGSSVWNGRIHPFGEFEQVNSIVVALSVEICRLWSRSSQNYRSTVASASRQLQLRNIHSLLSVFHAVECFSQSMFLLFKRWWDSEFWTDRILHYWWTSTSDKIKHQADRMVFTTTESNHLWCCQW